MIIQSQGTEENSMKSRYILILPVLAAVFIIMALIGGCSPKQMVSQSQEIEIGKEASKDLEKQYKLVKDPKLNEMVNTMGQTLAKYSDRPDLTYTFKIIDTKDVNAVSLPGGWVYVYKGLIDKTNGHPDQLAGAIAHEIGHVAARHHADILVGVLTKDQTQQIASIFANVTLLRWSRKHEYEADKLGIEYMYRSKQYDPQGLINFFKWLLSQEGKKPSELEQIFQTHPVTSERIARAQKYYDDLRNGTVQAK
jgi:predicted Zn-dependent protease